MYAGTELNVETGADDRLFLLADLCKSRIDFPTDVFGAEAVNRRPSFTQIFEYRIELQLNDALLGWREATLRGRLDRA